MSALDAEADGFAHTKAKTAGGAWTLAVISLDGVFGFAVLRGAGYFADAAPHAGFLFGDYSFNHVFSLSLNLVSVDR